MSNHKYKDPVKQELYNKWRGIKARCYKEEAAGYKSYGARGIRVCDEWKRSFLAFYEWALHSGFSPGLTIDRIDPDGNYEPSNCQWLDFYENCDRKRKVDRSSKTKKLNKDSVLFIHNHPELSSSLLADILNVCRSTVWNVRSGATWPEYHPNIEAYERGGKLLKRVSWEGLRNVLTKRWWSKDSAIALPKLFRLYDPHAIIYGMRAININGDWWFHTYDVLDLLGYSATSIASVYTIIYRLPYYTIKRIRTAHNGTTANMYYLNMDGLKLFIHRRRRHDIDKEQLIKDIESQVP